jgi:hypothetical protein
LHLLRTAPVWPFCATGRLIEPARMIWAYGCGKSRAIVPPGQVSGAVLASCRAHDADDKNNTDPADKPGNPSHAKGT